MGLDILKKRIDGINVAKLKDTAHSAMSKLKEGADSVSKLTDHVKDIAPKKKNTGNKHVDKIKSGAGLISAKANSISTAISNIGNCGSVADLKAKGKELSGLAESLGFSKSLNALTANPVFKRVTNVVEASGAVTMSLNWAYDMTMSDNLPLGLANSMTLAREYREKAASVSDACNNLIKMEMAKTCGGGFLTSLYGISSLPINMSLVFFLQLRMINAIASLGGRDLDAENVKKIAFMTLTGSSMSKDMMKNSIPTIMKYVAEKLAPKMLGTGALTKSLPFVSGFIGTSIDAITTYGIAKLAQSEFLGDVIEKEAICKMQEQRIKLLINMAHVDNDLSDEEKQMLLSIINEADVPDCKKEELLSHIDDLSPLKIDFAPLKADKNLSNNIIIGLVEMLKADGRIAPEEKAYLQSTAKSLGLSCHEINSLL